MNYATLLSICIRLAYELSDDAGRTLEDLYGEAEDIQVDQDSAVWCLADELRGLAVLSPDVIRWLDGKGQPERGQD